MTEAFSGDSKEPSQLSMNAGANEPPAPAPPDTEASAMPTPEDESAKVYNLFVAMEEIVDKLTLLEYTKDIVKAQGPLRKPVQRHALALSTNPGEQFHVFGVLAAYLIRKCGKTDFEMPQEHDDPNATIARILQEVRSLGHTIEFAPNKLKSGAGEHCVRVLDLLSDSALSAQNFAWRRPHMVVEEPETAQIETDEAEITTEQFDDEVDVVVADDDDDVETGFYDAPVTDSGTTAIGVGDDAHVMLNSDTNARDWALEVERVTPSLKIVVRQDAKDWRGHLEQMQTYQSSITDTLSTARAQLQRLSDDIRKSLDKIASREKYLNSQLDGLLSQYRQAQDRLAEIREKYREASSGITERSRRLADLGDELEHIKQQMEERGVSLTDGAIANENTRTAAPLVKLKQAIAQLERELIEMDIEIGVLDQALLQAQLRESSTLHQMRV